jgi:predicted MFS family arabinose efflux permease
VVAPLLTKPGATTASWRHGHGALAPFGSSLFVGIWVANVASSLGGQLQQVGTAWLMLALAPSPQMIALVSSAITAPIFLFSLLSGAIADVIDRRRVLLIAQCFMLLVSAALSILSFADVISPLSLLFGTFLLFSGFALNAPAWQAMVGELVPREQLSAAIALNTLGMNLARTIGPAIGGLVVGSFGPKAAFAANAVSYVFLIVILLRWRRTPPIVASPPEPVFSAVTTGLRYVVYSRAVRPILARAFWVGIGASAVTALAPVVVTELLNEGPVAFGTLLTCSGVGAVVGAAVSHMLRVRFSYEGVSRLAIAVYAIGILGIALSRFLPLTGAAMFLTGASMVLSMSTFAVAVQSNVPGWVTGRAISVYQMAMFGGMTLGSFIWGQVAALASTPVALMGASGVMAFALLLGLRTPLLALDPAGLVAASTGQAAGPSLAIDDPDAALTILVEYRVSSKSVPDFLGLMSERRRSRLRDGVRRWGLLQDTVDPECWVERFESRNLADYLRHRERHTIEDLSLAERLGSLNESGQAPTERFLFERSASLAPGERLGGP